MYFIKLNRLCGVYWVLGRHSTEIDNNSNVETKRILGNDNGNVREFQSFCFLALGKPLIWKLILLRVWWNNLNIFWRFCKFPNQLSIQRISTKQSNVIESLNLVRLLAHDPNIKVDLSTRKRYFIFCWIK